MNKQARQLLKQIHQHPDYPVAKKEFRIQKTLFEQMRKAFCPPLSRDDIIRDWIDGDVSFDDSLFGEINHWSHEIAKARLTQEEREVLKRYHKECRPLRKRFLEAVR